MLKKYVTWIKENVADAQATCEKYTTDMLKAFPELTRVRGHIFVDFWGRDREHWWLTAEDGSIVDPTVSQFPWSPLNEYKPWNEGAEEPTGKCRCCGAYTFGGEDACSKECFDVVNKDFGGRLIHSVWNPRKNTPKEGIRP